MPVKFSDFDVIKDESAMKLRLLAFTVDYSSVSNISEVGGIGKAAFIDKLVARLQSTDTSKPGDTQSGYSM